MESYLLNCIFSKVTPRLWFGMALRLVAGLVGSDAIATATANSANVADNGSNYFKGFTLANGTASNYMFTSAGYDAATIGQVVIQPHYFVVGMQFGKNSYAVSSTILSSVSGSVPNAPAEVSYRDVTPINGTSALISGVEVVGDNYKLISSTLIAPMTALSPPSAGASGQYVMAFSGSDAASSAVKPIAFTIAASKKGDYLLRESRSSQSMWPYSMEDAELLVKADGGVSKVVVSYRNSRDAIQSKGLEIALH